MKKGAIVLSALLSCSACGSSPARPGDHVTRFTSEPPGAVVRIGAHRCVTPCALALPPGEYGAAVESSAVSRDVVVTAGKDGNGVAATFQLWVGNTLHATGTVLNAVGEAGLATLQSTHVAGGHAEAAIFLTVGVVSVGSTVVGKVMTKAGQMMVDHSASPTEVHLVLTDPR